MKDDLQAPSVMLIDDEELDSFIVGRMIRHTLSNIKINSCLNGLKAIQTLKRLLKSNPNELPDYIFLDLSMPVMDGFQFLNEYDHLNIDPLKKTKIYVLSSSIFTADIKRALSSSLVTGFISKPLNSQKLKEIFDIN